MKVEPISSAEVKNAVNEMKNNKSIALGDIPFKLVKFGPNILWKGLANNF